MRLVFSRGTLIKAASAKPSASHSAALSFSWENREPRGLLLEGTKEFSLSLDKLGEGLYRLEHDEFGSIILGKTPWWSELPTPIGERGVWLSYQGYSSGVWHDGVFGRWEDKQWTDLVLPGPKFTLEYGRSRLALEDVEGFWHEEKHFAQKQSLIEGVRQHFTRDFSAPTLIQQKGSNADFVLNLLLLRLAFPRARWLIQPEDVAWKRLAQNLNIDPVKDGLPATQVAATFALGPKEKVIDLLRWQQAKSPFIPQNLLASLLD